MGLLSEAPAFLNWYWEVLNTMYRKLFERGNIGNLELKNRIFKAAAQNTPCPDGKVSERLINFYTEEACGGAGLIIVGLARVSKHETPGPAGYIGIENEDCISGFGALAQAIHDNGAKCCLQLTHLGSHAHPPLRCVSRKGIEHDPWIHTHLPDMKEFPHTEYTIPEIRELAGFYGDAAVRAVKAGFDMIEVHAAHRHGLGLFVSPLTNRRNDMYGGAFENRTRVLFEVIDDIKNKIGADFPLIVRLNGSDCHPDGQGIDEAVELARQLESVGVDAINMSDQNATAGTASPLGVFAWAAEAVKKAVSIPVMSCGSINTPEIAEEILSSGKADFVGTARAHFADPYWPRKAKEGRPEDIRPCVRCMECSGPRYKWKGPIVCAVNVTLGKETIMPIIRAQTPKKVAIIGGGLAGMEAARICALRGHQATIYEKRKLGGVLNEASVPDFKADLRRLLAYYETQIKKLEIPVVIKEANVTELKKHAYDTAIIATGAKTVMLNTPGADNENVFYAIDVFEKKPELGERITIVGGGNVSVEMALWLVMQGKTVTILKMRDGDDILIDESGVNKAAYMTMLQQQPGIQILTGHRLLSINNKSVSIERKEDKTRRVIECDNVIITSRLRGDLSFRDLLDQDGSFDVYAVGDCLSPRKIYDAIHEGNICAREI